VRIGGFGGVEGLVRHLAEHAIGAVIDATHPYAAQISANAVAACARGGVPLVSIVRPAWMALPGDVWQSVPSTEAAVEAWAGAPRRVCVSLGPQGLVRFAAGP